MTTESAFSLVATLLALVYVLTYAWAQIEIFAILIGFWKEKSKSLLIACGLLWAVMNFFAFLIALEVHFDLLRGRLLGLRIRLFGHDIIESVAPGAKAGAVLIILVYWAWVIGTFYLAVLRSRRTRSAEREEPSASP